MCQIDRGRDRPDGFRSRGGSTFGSDTYVYGWVGLRSEILWKTKSTMVLLELFSAIFWQFSDQICKNFALRALKNCGLAQHQWLIHQKGHFFKNYCPNALVSPHNGFILAGKVTVYHIWSHKRQILEFVGGGLGCVWKNSTDFHEVRGYFCSDQRGWVGPLQKIWPFSKSTSKLTYGPNQKYFPPPWW